MAYFVISFDLKHARLRNYQNFYQALRSFDGIEIREFVYIVDPRLSISRLFSEIHRWLHENDALFIAEFAKKPSWTKTLPGTKAWIDARFP